MTSLYQHLKYFTDATKIEVNSIEDVPKLTKAMRDFGWFESADKIDGEVIRIKRLCLGEFNIVDNAATS